MYTTVIFKVCIHFHAFSHICLTLYVLDKHDKNWAFVNYVSARALAQAENVRAQLQRTMERFDIDLVSMEDASKLYVQVRIALVCGFFMQVAHKEGEKGNYLTVKDNQVSRLVGFCICFELIGS